MKTMYHGKVYGILCFMALIVDSQQETSEEKLFRILFKAGYNPEARPVINAGDTVTVDLEFSLLAINNLDIKNQVLTSSGKLKLTWKDARLSWTPSDHDDIKKIIVKPQHMWTPDITLMNGADGPKHVYNDEYSAILHHDGRINWEPASVFKTWCTIDMEYYPFDSQICEYKFGAWSQPTNMMDLTLHTDFITVDSYYPSGEWGIMSVPADRGDYAYECCPDERYVLVTYTMKMRRRHQYYVINVILPTIMTSLLLLTTFFCPSTVKIQIAVLVLVSFQVFMLNVADQIPKTSYSMPLLSVYLTNMMLITVMTIMLTLTVINIRDTTNRPVPRCLRTLCFKYLATLLCLSCCKYGNTVRRSSGGHRSASLELANVKKSDNDENAALDVQKSRDAECASRKEEWHMLAKIIDRLLFWIVLIAIIIVTIKFFSPIFGRNDKYILA